MPQSGIITNPNIYTGKLYPEIIMPMVLDSVTFNSDAVRLHSDVNGKEVIGTQTVDFTIQGYNDAFQADGTINQNLSNIVLTPVPMTVNMKLPKSDFYVSYIADMLPAGIGVNSNTYGQWVAQALSELLKPQISSDIESIVWTGTLLDPTRYTVPSPPEGAISQIITQAPAARKYRNVSTGTYASTAVSAAGVFTLGATTNLEVGDIVTVASSTGTPTIDGLTIVGQSFVILSKTATTLTTASFVTGEAPTIAGSGSLTISLVTINQTSVFDSCNLLIKTLPDKVKYAVNSRGAQLKWVVSPNVADAYNIRLTQNGNAQANYLNIDPQTMKILETYGNRMVLIFGIPALIVPSLPPNTMILYPSDSIHVGMDIATDQANLNIIDLSRTINENFWSIRADWQIDTKITFANQFSLISPLV